jgi:hypothetical protein
MIGVKFRLVRPLLFLAEFAAMNAAWAFDGSQLNFKLIARTKRVLLPTIIRRKHLLISEIDPTPESAWHPAF